MSSGATPSSWRAPAPVVWLLLLALYVGLGLWLKATVLNWTIGPLFPLLVLGLVPAVLRRLSASWTSSGGSG